MRIVQKLWIWYYLLSKRLLKKYSFLLILLLSPLLVKGMERLAEQESGVLKILLCQEDKEECISEQIIEQLMEEESILRYEKVDSFLEAEAEIKGKNADAAWIFPKDIKERLEAYAKGQRKQKPLVTIVEREDNVALRLSREKLYRAVYPVLSYGIYRNYVKELPELTQTKEERLRTAYMQTAVEGSLFEFGYADEKGADGREQPYLLMPMRGLLALVVMLCGLAGAMYQLQDEQSGRYVWISYRQRLWFSLFFYVPVLVNGALAAGLALYFSHLLLDVKRELLLAVLYLIMIIGFCEILRQWLGKLSVLGAAIPILLIGMLVLCPIFLEPKGFEMLQYLLPPFYYLKALYEDVYIGKSVIYIAAIYGILFLTRTIKES